MYRIIVALMLTTIALTGIARGEECTPAVYGGLVIEGKNADANRLWETATATYERILADCRSQVPDSDFPKIYDALAVSQLMQEQYSAALDTAKKCLDRDGRYSACMMIAARASLKLGDRAMAEQFARDALAVEPTDEYATAVAIDAKDFLKRLAKPQQ